MHLNIYIKQTLFVGLLCLGLTALPGQAQFIDTFSTDTSADYDIVTHFLSGGSNQTYAINGSNQFQPNVSATGASTTYFLRNTGESLSDTNFNESVSIDIDGLGTNGAAGLSFSTSLTSATAAGTAFEIGIVNNPGSSTSGALDFSGLTGVTPASTTENFSLGPIVVDVTRTGDTTFSYSLTGAGLTSGAISGTFTDASVSGKNLFFGMEAFESQHTALQIEDNLTFAIPEPSSLALMAAAAGLLILAFRFRRVAS